MNIEEKLALGKVLVELRKKANMTQEDLEDRSGVPLRTIQRAEKEGCIRTANLEFLAKTFKIEVSDIMAQVKELAQNPPMLRLAMRELTTAAELLDCLNKKGNLQISPEGEHSFNEELGLHLTNLRDDNDRKAAQYALDFCHETGFRIFGVHYIEELKHKERLIRKPTTIVFAAPEQDKRIRKSSKGYELDYLMDKRKGTLHQMLNSTLTTVDWMEHQLLTRSDGEARVEAVMEEINRRIKNKRKK